MPIIQFSARHSPKKGLGRPKKGEILRSASYMITAKHKTPITPISVSDTLVSGVDFMASKRLYIDVPSDEPMKTSPVESLGSIP